MSVKTVKTQYDFNSDSDLLSKISFGDFVIFPGFCDVHVHFREPGFSYKETIRSGSLAAAAGGYTAVCTMPNLSPVPDCKDNIEVQLDIIKNEALINVYPYSAITVGQKGQELVDFDTMKNFAVAFSDDGKGVQSEEMMKKAMTMAAKYGKIIAAHCEDESLLHGGYIHDGLYARTHGHRGICSESEWGQIERDVFLAEKTGCAYHVCHISTKESVDIIRKAKKRGVNVTCETAPHYLLLDENRLNEEGRYKMNPPLRSEEDRKALIEGLLDGTVDMIATDHAPHSEEEKNRGLEKSLFGIVGLETAFPVLYTYLVKKNVISLEKLIDLMAISPRKRFGIPLENGDITVFETSEKYKISSAEFKSKGRATPFDGFEVYGRCMMTKKDGETVYEYKN